MFCHSCDLKVNETWSDPTPPATKLAYPPLPTGLLSMALMAVITIGLFDGFEGMV